MAKQYVEPQKRYDDQRSTGIVFLGMGIIGIIGTILCWLDILNFPFDNFQLLILLIIFLACICLGIWSFKKASEIAKTISSENDYVANAREWIAETKDRFCIEDASDISDSEIYFQREQEIRNAISQKFPDMEEDLLDELVEETYHSLFE